MRASAPIFSSSVVNPEPSGSNRSHTGITLKAIVRGNTSPTGSAPRSTAPTPSASSWPCSFSICSVSSRMPFMPAPDTDWYDDVTRNVRPNARCRGPRGISAVIAVQLLLATIPLCPSSASGLI